MGASRQAATEENTAGEAAGDALGDPPGTGYGAADHDPMSCGKAAGIKCGSIAEFEKRAIPIDEKMRSAVPDFLRAGSPEEGGTVAKVVAETGREHGTAMIQTKQGGVRFEPIQTSGSSEGVRFSWNPGPGERLIGIIHSHPYGEEFAFSEFDVNFAKGLASSSNSREFRGSWVVSPAQKGSVTEFKVMLYEPKIHPNGYANGTMTEFRVKP